MARAALGEAAFLEATHVGRSLPLAEAIELALSPPAQASDPASTATLGAAGPG